ncbi:hypothetical protein [Acinetobacter modestus]|uniref:hypothetical protein n=1 Tax=Acinetobacter modestus TaxID=1776740 RepID=UPI001F4A1F72|nr:hypothetical protein [Acinetobacter modestus]MCH7330889.1 hypothetical protein [Acinetobacter modestus]
MNVYKRDMIPILLLGGVNILTLILFLISPFNYLYGNSYLSSIYVLINIGALFFGYFFSIMLFGTKKYKLVQLYKVKTDNQLFNLLLFFYILTFIFRYAYLLKFQFYDLFGIINEILLGVVDPKYGYLSTLDSSKAFTLPWSLYAFISIFHSLFFISGAIFWGKLSSKNKILFSFFILFEAVFWYSRGTNFGIISLIIIFFLSYLLNMGKVNLKSLSYILLLVFIIIIVFSGIMYSRMGDITDLSSYEIYMTTINYDSYIFTSTPDFLKPTLLTFFSYLTQGYYFLSFGFDLDYRFSNFLGSNPALINIASLLGLDNTQNSYVHRLTSYGIDPNIQWHSAYLWIANDFSFYFVPLYVCLLGFGLGVSWIFATRCNDFVFKVVFVILGGSIVFLFANNNFISSYLYLYIFMFFLSLLKVYFLIKRG